VGERRVVRVKRKRNESDKAVRLILDFAQFYEVVDALFFAFDVAVEHGGVGGQADFVSLFGGIEPNLAADFVVADDAAHARMENFGTAAGARVHSCFFHAAKNFFNGNFGDAGEVVDFHHGEGFEVDTGAALFESANHFEEIVKRQIGVEAADDVKFGGAFADALFGALVDFVERKVVSAG